MINAAVNVALLSEWESAADLAWYAMYSEGRSKWYLHVIYSILSHHFKDRFQYVEIFLIAANSMPVGVSAVKHYFLLKKTCWSVVCAYLCRPLLKNDMF